MPVGLAPSTGADTDRDVRDVGSSVWQVVPGNRWDLLDVPVVGGWTPTLKVSVVLPYYQAPETLEITLAALSAQTYPSELLEVIVADDGSNPPLELPEGLRGLDVTVLHQEDRGFGAPRARNMGARAADGEILVFMDCDMVPEPWQVEAHARWHHVCNHAVTLGFRRHVEFDGVGPDEVAAMGADGLAPLFADREQQVPEWIEGHMVRTDGLTSAHDDLFRIVTGGNLGMRAKTYWSVGGSDESFTQWGGEDTELGYRLFVNGALLVPDRQAQCWHQGHGHEPEPSELKSLEQQHAKMAHIMAHPGFRGDKSGRSYTIPRLAVEIEVGDTSGLLARQSTESVLSSTFHDLHVYLRVADDHPSYLELSRDVGNDPRVTIGDAPVLAHTPYVLQLPAGAVVEPGAISGMIATMREVDHPVGVLRTTVPHRRPREVMATMVSTRALERARVVATGEVVDTAGKLFGQRWVTGLDAGVVWAGQDKANAQGEGQPVQKPDASEMAQLQQLWDAFGKMEPSQRRAILALAGRVLGGDPRLRAVLFGLLGKMMAVYQALSRLTKIWPVANLRQLISQTTAKLRQLTGRVGVPRRVRNAR